MGSQVPPQPPGGRGGGLGRAGPGRRQGDEGDHQGQNCLRPSLRGEHRPCQAPEPRLFGLGIKNKQNTSDTFLCSATFKPEVLTSKYKAFILEFSTFFPSGLNKAKLGWLWLRGNIREISAGIHIHCSNYSQKRSYNKLVLTTKIVFSFCLFRRKFNNRIFYHQGISNLYQ